MQCRNVYKIVKYASFVLIMKLLRVVESSECRRRTVGVASEIRSGLTGFLVNFMNQ